MYVCDWDTSVLVTGMAVLPSMQYVRAESILLYMFWHVQSFQTDWDSNCSVWILAEAWLSWLRFFRCFPQSVQLKCQDSTPIRPQSLPFRSIPVQQSFYHSHCILDVAKLWLVSCMHLCSTVTVAHGQKNIGRSIFRWWTRYKNLLYGKCVPKQPCHPVHACLCLPNFWKLYMKPILQVWPPVLYRLHTGVL
jgi:hypothetical protein